MKKRFVLVLISLLVVQLLCSCGSSGEESSSTAAEQTTEATVETTQEATEESTAETIDEADLSVWMLANVVDEFGDTVEDNEDIIFKSLSIGDFSNTATSSSSLTVEIVDMVLMNNVFSFKLLEYDKTPATYTNSSSLSMKVKIGDEISEYSLIGTPPNSSLVLGVNNNDGNDLFNALYSGNDVRCIINIDSSQYNFTIYSNGFKELCEEAQEKLDIINEKNRVKDIASVVNKILTSEDGSAKLSEVFEYLTDNRNDYSIMSDEDIKREIDGDFYYVSLDDYKNNGIVFTYRYIMNYHENTQTQKLYFQDGIKTEKPQAQDSSSEFIYSNGIIDGLHPEQLRKMSDGYYVGYKSDGTDYTIPGFVIMKGHQETTGFVCEYPLPQD